MHLNKLSDLSEVLINYKSHEGTSGCQFWYHFKTGHLLVIYVGVETYMKNKPNQTTVPPKKKTQKAVEGLNRAPCGVSHGNSGIQVCI